MSTARCELCGRSFSKRSGSFVIGEHGKEMGMCRECEGVIVRNGVRYDVDVMVVPVREESLKKAVKENLYICPVTYFKRNPKFIAFYLGGEVGLITHVAKVAEINIVQARKIVKLENMVKLKNPIKRGFLPPIQSRIYVTFREFSKAKTFKDLRQRAED